MNLKQHTITNPVTLSGKGLHTGEFAEITLKPAAINSGIVFQRVDLENKPLIPALVDYVVDTSRSTVLEKDGGRVGTIEHLMSALVGCEIDNVLVEVKGSEIPILDGSAFPFVEAIESSIPVEQNAMRNFYEVTEAIHYKNEEKNIEIGALPLNDYRLTVMVDFNSQVIHSQHAQLHELGFYKEYISRCRTFVFVHDIEFLFKNGLIKGGDLNNAVVIAETEVSDDTLENLSKVLGRQINASSNRVGILNAETLKYPNEPARHKLLDLMGDLALVGRPLKAHILAARPGHHANVELARLIKKQIDASETSAPSINANEPPILTVQDIAKLLPHRYPFQLVDKIISLDGTTVIGVKNVTMNEPQFTGHFPDNPVMPGVLQVEAIAQTGGVLVLTSTGEPEKYWPYLVGIENCRFYKNVVPGDALVIKCTLSSPIRLGVAKMNGEAWVGKTLVCSVSMTARLVKK
jgi:UDP-3-O-[3-hydroxymyristoyl] N-acetylglucosamine deacetylase/3-hydroxyacyl-[acyl-carrier-protein] dehydratase